MVSTTCPAHQELREISDKIVAARRKLGEDKGDNYFYSTEIQVLEKARATTLADFPAAALAFEHPEPGTLPPPLKRPPSVVREMAEGVISNTEEPIFKRDKL